MTMSDPVVYCNSCGASGATVHRGWQLLCGRCQSDDLDWFDE